jgi:hypothetical protein
MSAEVVLVGRVTDVRRARVRGPASEPVHRVHLVVLEAFRGVSDRGVDIVTSTSSCGISFKRGEEYLIYAWRDRETGLLKTSACSRTNLAAQSVENIENLRGLTSGQGPSQVFGFVTREPSDLQLPFRASVPISGVRIHLRSGDKSWQTTTDERGEYEFGGLPGGVYEASADLVDGPADQRQRRFTLVSGGCSRQNFLGVTVGRIAGRLIDSDNQPVPNVLVEIKGVPPTPDPRLVFSRFTDAEGRFIHEMLPMGEYLLGVNLRSPPNKRDWYGKRAPFERSFFPGVTVRNEARILKLQAGQNIEELVFQLPPRPNVRTIHGRAVFPDGSPATAVVALLDLDYPGDEAQVEAVLTDRDGGFWVAGIEGRPYALLATGKYKGRLVHSGFTEISPDVKELVRLVLSRESCEICSRFQIWRSPLW